MFRILDEDQRAWEVHRAKESRSDPKKIELIFAQLAFGDETGFNGTDAKAYPYKREQSTGESKIGFVASIRPDFFNKKTGSVSAGYFLPLDRFS